MVSADALTTAGRLVEEDPLGAPPVRCPPEEATAACAAARLPIARADEPKQAVAATIARVSKAVPHELPALPVDQRRAAAPSIPVTRTEDTVPQTPRPLTELEAARTGELPGVEP